MKEIEHKYAMRGLVIYASGDDIYLCIGSNDGAKVGQKLTVHRFERIDYKRKLKPAFKFKRLTLGSVQIVEIVDEHSARAKILTGPVAINDVVELRPN